MDSETTISGHRSRLLDSSKSEASPNHTYFPHIDGLRAVAVLLVIFFHFNLLGFYGGFIGVDVFFVISGYLVSRNILNEIEDTGSLSLRRFFVRRFWRLYPSALATCAWTLLVARLIFPELFRSQSAKSVIGALFSVANIMFWQEDGYWDVESGMKPLLHMWSLSVEEQFYLVWPGLLLVASRIANRMGEERVLGSKTLVFTVFSASVISFAAAFSCQQGSSSAAFFLFHFRVFEFGAGALTFLISREREMKVNTSDGENSAKTSWHGVWAEFWSLVSLFVLAQAGQLYSEGLFASPGTGSLPVILATGLLLSSGETFVGQTILSNTFLRWIGKLSYALYLVHWPLWVFTTFIMDAVLLGSRQQVGIFCLLLIFPCATLQNALVEEPLRRGPRSRIRSFTIGVVLLLVVLYASIGVSTNGWRSLTREEKSPDQYREERVGPGCFGTSKSGLKCRYGHGPKVITFFGDSMLLSLRPGLRRIAAKYRVTIHEYSHLGCEVLLSENPLCGHSAEFFYELQKKGNFEEPSFVTMFSEKVDLDSMKEQFTWLERVDFKPIWIGNAPGASYDAYSCINRSPLLRLLGRMVGSTICPMFAQAIEELEEANIRVRKTMSSYLGREKFISLYPPFSMQHTEEGESGDEALYQVLTKDGKLLYIDDHHITTEGSKMTIPVIEAYMLKHGLINPVNKTRRRR